MNKCTIFTSNIYLEIAFLPWKKTLGEIYANIIKQGYYTASEIYTISEKF